MDQKNVFLTVKTAVAALCGAFTAAFGWLGWLVAAWVASMCLDFTTGTVAAWMDGSWRSCMARKGIAHKAGMLCVVCVASLTDGVLGMATAQMGLDVKYTMALLPMVLVWYIVGELGSVGENAIRMGAPVPKFLTRILAIAKDATERTADPGEDDANE